MTGASAQAAAGPTTHAMHAAAEPARGGPGRFLVAMAAVAGLVVLDLASKAAVWPWLTRLLEERALNTTSCTHGHPRYLLVGEWLAFMRNQNAGAAFGMFDGVPHLLVAGRGLAVILLTWLVWRAPKGQPGYLTALVLILSGAVGNLYDNLAKPLPPLGDSPYGPVRDFIDVYFYVPSLGLDWHFPTFNVADSCITCGAVLLLLSGLVADLRSRREARARPEAGEAGAIDPATGS